MNDKFEMIKDRIAHILRAKNITATQFAELMQIQPSNVSHILNGRNKPSLDFITKLKEVFPEYSFDWIIMGKKPITINEPNLFPIENINQNINSDSDDNTDYKETQLPLDFNTISSDISIPHDKHDVNNTSFQLGKLKQIVYVYDDHTFEIYDIRKF